MASMCSAITFPPACLQPDPTVASTSCAATSSPALSTAPALLFTLPSEILLAIINNLTVTSGVHLALTCRRLATLLTTTPGILSFNVRSLSSSVTRLLRTDGSFRCWSVYRNRRNRYLTHPNGALIETRPIRHMDADHFALECRNCHSIFEHTASRDHLPELPYEGYHGLMLIFHPDLFEHTRRHACRGGGGRILTPGMFECMEVFIRDLVKEQNLEWAKAAVVSWAIA